MIRRTLKCLIVTAFLAMPALAAIAPVDQASARWGSWSAADTGGRLVGRPRCERRVRHHHRLIIVRCPRQHPHWSSWS